MASTGARTLTLLALLQRQRFWSGAQLAARLEVSERTLRRDVERLRDLGYEVVSARGVEGGYQLAAGATLPPLALEPHEAVALAAGLHAMAHGASPEVADASVTALGKLISLLPPALRRQADAVRAVTDVGPRAAGAPDPSPQVLGVVAQACRDGVRLTFDYVSHDGDASARYVEPYRLVVVRRRWYLLAYDIDRRDWRTFRADRMSEPAATRAPFERRSLPADDLPAYVTNAIGAIRVVHHVEVDVALPADDVAARIGRWAQVTPRTAAACRLVMDVDTLDWSIVALAALDADFTVIEPPELRTRITEVATRLGRSCAPVDVGNATTRTAR